MLVVVHSGVNSDGMHVNHYVVPGLFSTLVVVVFLWLEQASKNTRGTIK